MSSTKISCDRCGIQFVYARPTVMKREYLAICPGCGHENPPAPVAVDGGDAANGAGD